MKRFIPSRTATHHPASPLTRKHMPSRYDFSLKSYTQNRAHRIPNEFGPKQALEGFDPDYRNIIDYIVRITHRIWETELRDVDYIADCYASDCLVYDDYGLQVGNQKIIADTYHTTAAFPDILLDAEEVIWAGDDDIGFHTSHLTRIVGTNSQPSRYGDATHARVNFLVIANCVALRNDIFLEHVLYNTSAMLQQLGIDLWKEAERLIAEPPAGWPRTDQIWSQMSAAVSPDQTIAELDPVDGFDPDAYSRQLHDNIWNDDGSTIDRHYAPGFEFEGTTERSFSGTDAYRAYVNAIKTTFPDLTLQVDEVYWMGNDEEGYLISTRWSAEGTHTGGTLYRKPSQARCQIWGITQWRIRDFIVVQEWQLFNEFDVMMQISKARLGQTR